MELGITEASSSGFAVMGFCMGAFEQEYSLAIKLYANARDLADKFDDLAHRGRVYLHAGMLPMFLETPDHALELYRQAFENSLDVNNLNYCCYAATLFSWTIILKGTSLDMVLFYYNEYAPFVRKARESIMLASMYSVADNVCKLSGRPRIHDHHELERQVRGVPFAAMGFFVLRMQACYLLREQQEAMRCLRQISRLELLQRSPGMPATIEFPFVAALVLCRQARSTPSQSARYADILSQVQEYLRMLERAHTHSRLFEHKVCGWRGVRACVQVYVCVCVYACVCV
jgi:tetratricopeptide (TPR) repeat protein